jgi:hypothetical protein
MRRTLIASACALALVAAGCGSDNTAKRETACAEARSAINTYHHAGQSVGADFFNRAADERVIVAAAAFRARIKQLEPLTSAGERKQLEGLTGALEQHEKLLQALGAHDLPTAHEYATPAFEQALDSGQASFEKICRPST